MRAAEDLEQAKVLAQMRDFQFAQPISDDLLESLVQRTLSKHDLNSSSLDLEDSWEMAPVCVDLQY